MADKDKDKVEKLTVADAKKDTKLMKKVDKLEKAEQTKWVKAYVSEYNKQVKDGATESKAAKAAATAADEKVPVKKEEKGKGKGKKASIDFKTAYVEDRKLLAEAGVELNPINVDDFLSWCDASGVALTAKDEQEIEFNDEEKAILAKATKAVISKEGDNYVVLIQTDSEEDGAVEISIGDEENMEDEMDEMVEDVMDEGADIEV